MSQKESPKENSQKAVFIDPDVLPFIDLDDRKRVNVINPVLTKQISIIDVYVKTIVNIGGFFQGQMMFGARAFQEDSNTGSNTYSFTVVYGEFEVIINEQKRLVEKGVTFVVPPNLNYSIHNRSGKIAELTFLIISDMPYLAAVIEAGQQDTSSADFHDVQQKTNE